MEEIEKAEFIEISSGIYVLENKIKCELNIENYLSCDKFAKNTRGCINCDCVIIEDEDKYSLEIMADELQNHKAVVETMQNKIDELENTKVDGNCTCSVKQAVIDSQKDKINELERQITYLYMGGKMSNETLDNLMQLAKGIK